MSGLLGLGGNIPALGLFQRLAKSDESTLAAKYANTPAVKKEIEYVKQQIAAMKSPDDLYKNYRVMRFVLSAYGLDSELKYPGRIKKVLESDMSDQNSLANKLRDARYREIASALAIKSTGVKTLQNATTLDAIVQKYTINEYEKSFEQQNPAIREGLYFLRNIGKVTSPYEILADPVLSKVVRTVLGLPDQIALQPIESQAELITKRLDVKQFNTAAAASSTTSTQTTNAKTDLSAFTKMLSIADGAATAVKTIADKLQAIKSRYDGLAALQSASGVNAAEIPVQNAAVPDLLRQQGLLDTAQSATEAMAADVKRMSELRLLAADPANAASLASYKSEFAVLAQHIHDSADSGADYRFNGTDQSLLDGTVSAPIAVQINSAGKTVTVAPQDVSGFLAQVDAAATAFAAVTDASDTANLGAVAGAITAGGPQLGTVRDAIAAAMDSFTDAIQTVTTWAPTLNSAALETGLTSVENAGTRANQITAKLAEIRSVARQSTLLAAGDDRSALTSQLSTLVGDLSTLVNTPGSGADNLLTGTDRSYSINGSVSLTARGHDLVTSVLNPISAASVASSASAQALIDQIDGAVGDAVDAAKSVIATDADVFNQASVLYDPRGAIDAELRLLSSDLPSLVAAGKVSGKNLLDPAQADLITISKLQSRSYTIAAQPTFASSLTASLTAALGQLPGNLSGAGGAYEKLQDALFTANKTMSALDPGRRAARDMITQAQRIISDADAATKSSGTTSKATDFARKFLNRYLGLKDAADAGSLEATSSDPRSMLLSAAGGSVNLLA